MIFKILSFSMVLISVYLNYNLFYQSFDHSLYRNTTSGLVRGLRINVLNQSIDQFLGIPYAEQPVGRLRFAKSMPIEFQNEVIDSTKPKNSCIQPFTQFIGNLSQSEDCLTLNIWSPTQEDSHSTQLKPVMFWIYGGGLTVGSIFQKQYNGSVLATHHIVFVSVNYRLGQLGFLYGDDESAPGNVGLYDQVLALEWVRENIHLFGGDRNQITICGQGAGSWSVSTLLISPLAQGLFRRAIMQSGAHFYNKKRPTVNKWEALLESKKFAKQQNCLNDYKWLQCLRGVDAKQFAQMDSPLKLTFPLEGTEFSPLSSQKAFNEFEFNYDLDIMAGVTKDEGSLLSAVISSEVMMRSELTKEDFIEFVDSSEDLLHNLNVETITEFYLNNINTSDSNAIKWKIFDFFGDLMVKCPTYLFAKRYAEQSSPETDVYFYQLSHIMKELIPGQHLGIHHSAELDFMFGLSLVEPNSTSDQNIGFTEEVLKLWTNFVKYGKPDDNWPQLIDTKTHSSVTKIKDLNPKTPNKYFNDFFDETCDGFWLTYYQDHYFRHFKVDEHQ